MSSLWPALRLTGAGEGAGGATVGGAACGLGVGLCCGRRW